MADPAAGTARAPGPPSDPPPARSACAAFGTFLCRVVVPLWVLAGAAFKLYERNPGNLPSVIRDFSRKQLGWENLDGLLRTLIGLELFAVAVMFLSSRFARPMAVFMLVCFCGILIGEIATGAATCGCFGSLPIKPWQMLIIDGTLLLLVIAFRPSRASIATESSASRPGWMVAAIALLGVSLGIAFIVPNPPVQEQTVVNNGSLPPAPTPVATQPDEAPAPATHTDIVIEPPATSESHSPTPTPPITPTTNLPPTVNPSPKPLPASWYTQKMNEWIGKPWRELEIFQLMPTWPREMDSGPRYIIFYSRTCEHCQTMLEVELVDPLDGLTTLVEVPASRTVMTDPNGWEMPMTVELILGAELLQLPLGPNWVITTPLIIKTVDGKVVCATEGGDHKKCLGTP